MGPAPYPWRWGQWGSVMIPEVGDEVLVGFEHGDPRQPIILGGLFGNKSTIPDWTVKDGKVSSRRFTSRLGHVWELSDGDEPGGPIFHAAVGWPAAHAER